MNDVNSRFTDFFLRIARQSAQIVGSPWTFLFAALVVIVWAIAGLLLRFPEVWLVALHTIVAILTFLMVALLQGAQNRELMALQLKLDELLKSSDVARTGLVNLQELSHDELEFLEEEFRRMRRGSARSEVTDRPSPR